MGCDPLEPTLMHTIYWVGNKFCLEKGPCKYKSFTYNLFCIKTFQSFLCSLCFVMLVEREGVEIEKTNHLGDFIVHHFVIQKSRNNRFVENKW